MMIQSIYQFVQDGTYGLTFAIILKDGSGSEFFTKDRIEYRDSDVENYLGGYTKVYEND